METFRTVKITYNGVLYLVIISMLRCPGLSAQNDTTESTTTSQGNVTTFIASTTEVTNTTAGQNNAAPQLYSHCVTTCLSEAGTNLPTGDYAYCDDCNAIAKCTYGRLDVLKCPLGTVYYDRVLGVCVSDSDVCINDSLTTANPTTEISTTTEKTEFITSTTPFTTTTAFSTTTPFNTTTTPQSSPTSISSTSTTSSSVTDTTTTSTTTTTTTTTSSTSGEQLSTTETTPAITTPPTTTTSTTETTPAITTPPTTTTPSTTTQSYPPTTTFPSTTRTVTVPTNPITTTTTTAASSTTSSATTTSAIGTNTTGYIPTAGPEAESLMFAIDLYNKNSKEKMRSAVQGIKSITKQSLGNDSDNATWYRLFGVTLARSSCPNTEENMRADTQKCPPIDPTSVGASQTIVAECSFKVRYNIQTKDIKQLNMVYMMCY